MTAEVIQPTEAPTNIELASNIVAESMSHEERIKAVYKLIFALIGLHGREVFQIQKMEENARIQASKDLSKSYRSLLPVAIGVATIGLGLAGVAVALYPRGGTGAGSQRLENLPSGVFDLSGGKNIDPTYLNKTIPDAITGLQHGTESGSRITDSFAEGSRTGYRTTGDLAQSRFGTASSEKQKLASESSETLRTLAQISETQARAEEALAR